MRIIREREYLIWTTLVPNQAMGHIALLFMRRSNNRDYQPTYLQSIEPRSPLGIVETKIKQAGLNIAKVTYALEQPGHPEEDLAEITGQLFA